MSDMCVHCGLRIYPTTAQIIDNLACLCDPAYPRPMTDTTNTSAEYVTGDHLLNGGTYDHDATRRMAGKRATNARDGCGNRAEVERLRDEVNRLEEERQSLIAKQNAMREVVDAACRRRVAWLADLAAAENIAALRAEDDAVDTYRALLESKGNDE